MKQDGQGRFFPVISDPVDDAPPRGFEPARRAACRIALVGCFRPRRCGIATFTADLHDHLRRENPAMTIDVYALRDDPATACDAGIAAPIEADERASYRAAAEAINRSGVDAVWLQHEFGIFGGAAGQMILDLVRRLAPPLIVTFHTVLAAPTDDQRQVLHEIAARALRLVVMSEQGRQTLIDVYDVPAARVAVIEHGAPDRSWTDISPLRVTLGLEDRPILSTFGLLGPGKGLETAIRALPAIVPRHPRLLYRIVGATHPNLIAVEGEAYREKLQALADSLGVSANLVWDNRFLDSDALLDQIELCDIYVAPYPNLAQITSGTLAYAVALGRAVVATPFVHARELLTDDVGLLVPPDDSAALADAVLGLLAAPETLRTVQRHAYARGRRTVWPVVARQSAALIEQIAVKRRAGRITARGAPPLTGVLAMCDDCGILQHGRGIVPDRHHGYCLDDNARALMLFQTVPIAEPSLYRQWSMRFAAFVQHAWDADGRRFRNFMSYDRRWLEDIGSPDSAGRALWALGFCAAHAPADDIAGWAESLFDEAGAISVGFQSPRAVAFAMLGAAELMERRPGHHGARAILDRGTALLDRLWHEYRRPGWDWLEPVVAYDNARLPEAMIRAGQRLGDAGATRAGLAMLEWLCGQQTAPSGCFRPVGSDGFGMHGQCWPFDQQPVEAWATIAACGAACRIDGAARWRHHADAAWRWFLGDNDRGIMLADAATGRCRDGLTPRGANGNVGAESVLAFHLAYHAMDRLFWTQGQEEGAIAIHAYLPT